MSEQPGWPRAAPAEVAKRDDVIRLRDIAFESFGDVGILMNDAAIGDGAGPWEHVDKWRRMLDVNLFGVLHGLDAFVSPMLAHGQPAAIVNVGSKQGITTPPGNAAYNVSKAGVKVLTEQLAHELRQTAGGRVTAHLLVPAASAPSFAAHFSRGIWSDGKPPGG